MPETNKDFLPASWWAVAAIVDAYESEAGEEFPELRRFVERVEEPFRREALLELIKVEVERCWQAGRRKHIEDYLQEFPELGEDKDSLEDLLQQECYVRSSVGDVPSAAELSSRFPRLNQRKLLDTEQGFVSTIHFGVNPLETKVKGPARDDSPPGGSVVSKQESDLSASDPTGTGIADSTVASQPFRRKLPPTVGPETTARGDSSTHDSHGQAARSGDQTVTPPPLAELTSIGRYEIREELGAGSFGKVLRCFDTDLKRDVAIKIPLLRRKNPGSRVEEFLHEAQSAARLKHPSIVAVLDSSRTDDGRVFIVYEFVEGQTLQSRLKQRDYQFEDAARWVADAADALHHAHKNGIVHRDIKPANIMLDTDGRICVADFGLATIDDQFFADDAGKVVGTVAYMSPEQASGKSHWATPQTDIYALGVLLYHLLTGRLPIRAGHVHEALAQIRERQPTPPRAIDDAIPATLEEICLKALAKSPADRYRTAGDMAAELRTAIAAVPPRKTAWPYWAAGGAAAAAALMMLFVPRWRDKEDVPPRQGNTPPAVEQLELTAPHVDIHYQLPDESGVYHVLRREPLNQLDKIQIHVDLNGIERYIYLYWYDTNGDLTRLWPNDTQLRQQMPVSSYRHPPESEDKWMEMDAAQGAETVLLAVRDTPLDAAALADFERYAPYSASDVIQLNEVFHLGSDELHEELVRGLGPTVYSRKNPFSARFRQKLNESFNEYHGMVIPHK
jgi:predicted Ser/Thr protein kinase